MDGNKDAGKEQEQGLRGLCPYCLSQVDVHLDVKQRPYWRCWRCEVRSFGTLTAFTSLRDHGWIWSEKRPIELFRGWVNKVASSIGLRVGKRRHGRR